MLSSSAREFCGRALVLSLAQKLTISLSIPRSLLLSAALAKELCLRRKLSASCTILNRRKEKILLLEKHFPLSLVAFASLSKRLLSLTKESLVSHHAFLLERKLAHILSDQAFSLLGWRWAQFFLFENTPVSALRRFALRVLSLFFSQANARKAFLVSAVHLSFFPFVVFVSNATTAILIPSPEDQCEISILNMCCDVKC